MRPALLAISSALLLVLAHSPWSAWPLAFVALVPLGFLALEAERPARHFLASYLGGCVLFVAGCFWLRVTTPINLALMTLVEALTFPLVVLLLRRFRRISWIPFWLALPLAWLAVEYTRSHVPWNGFPWLLLGYTALGPPALAQGADLVGVSGLSFLIALANGLLVAAIRCRVERARALAYLGLALLVPTALLLYGTLRIDAVLAGEVKGPRVALVQANVPQGLKQTLKTPTEIFDYQLRTTASAVRAAGAQGFDLLCWAETMFAGGLYHDEGERSEQLDRDTVGEILVEPLLRRSGAWFLTGVVTHQEVAGEVRPRRYNSVLLFDSTGRRRARYSKTVLVPGGEFIPLHRYLPAAIDRIVTSITGGFLPDLSAGDGPVPFVLEARDGREYRFANTICYENCYPSYSARSAALGIDFLVNLSNEAWFQESAEFDQMEVISRMRAIEARRSLLRVTNSGISAIYDAVGRRRQLVVGQDGRDRAVEGVLLADVPIFDASSWFTRLGDLVGLLATLLALVGALLAPLAAPVSRR